MKIAPLGLAMLITVGPPCAAVAQLPAAAPPPPAAQPPAQGRVAPPAAATPLPSVSPAPKDGIGYVTAAQLAGQCADQNPTNISYCFAYIAAVHDTMRAYEIWLGEKEFCAPPNVAQGDLRRSFLTYISAYPQNKGGQAASVIAIALKQSYPCFAVAPPSQPLPPPSSPPPSTPPIAGQP